MPNDDSVLRSEQMRGAPRWDRFPGLERVEKGSLALGRQAALRIGS